MNPKLFINLFFIWIVVLLLLLSSIALPLQSKADEATSVSDVLGRTVRLDALCDDFEDTNWHYDYQKGKDYRELWRRGSGRGEPELLKRVTTPTGGKSGSSGALGIRTNKIDSDSKPNQEDFLTAEFKQILGRELTRADQPVFIVHVWLPPFDRWGDYYRFGFRQESIRGNNSKYYSSIFLVYDKSESFFVFRIHLKDQVIEVKDGTIKQPGWWTLAIAFDEKGVDYYYACPGVDIPTEEGKIFDTKQFRTEDDTYNPLMDKAVYSFFSLMYKENGNASPRFVIDDYEVWVVKREGSRS